VIEPSLTIRGFSFTHDHCDVKEGDYTFCGHLHPGVVIHGMGKQSLRFPCFYFAKDHCILPAFSLFTGMATIEPERKANVYAIVEDSLIKIQ
jgi:metallophosphoesterase superfamily enzyme